MLEPLDSLSDEPEDTSARTPATWDSECIVLPGGAIAISGWPFTPKLMVVACVAVVEMLWPPSPIVPDICSARS